MRIVITATAALALSACGQSETTTPDSVDDAADTTEAAAPDLIETMGPPPVPDAADDAAAVIEGIENVRVSFDADSNSATIESSITGYETKDYLLNVGAGQAMNVSMATAHTSTYFNILEPGKGETGEAIFVGSTNGNQFEGVTAQAGDYRIRVYMMRSAARRDETAEYRLEMIVN
uniref:hypothetical protein n=1 Tax=uncultured Altererythrobacter sp. TaxID=500840 RepID=UPI00260CC21F|nr:hypothetical protein [uncultured Altererythrobacter sp.]